MPTLFDYHQLPHSKNHILQAAHASCLTRSKVIKEALDLEPIHIIGSGCFGKIYKKGSYAFKLPSSLDTESLQEEIKQLEFEMRILSFLKHPNIIQTTQVNITNSVMAIGMTYHSNGSIYDHLNRHQANKLTPHTQPLILGILSGLAYLHMLGIVHRDIKANNILLDEKMNPVIIDFGLAYCLSDNDAKNPPEHVAGFGPYLAPELLVAAINNHKITVDRSADIFAAGLLILEVLYGKTIKYLSNYCANKNDYLDRNNAILNGDFFNFEKMHNTPSITALICIHHLCHYHPTKRSTTHQAIKLFETIQRITPTAQAHRLTAKL